MKGEGVLLPHLYWSGKGGITPLITAPPPLRTYGCRSEAKSWNPREDQPAFSPEFQLYCIECALAYTNVLNCTLHYHRTLKNSPTGWALLYTFHMVLILDCNSEIGAHGRRNRCYLICIRHSYSSHNAGFYSFKL